MNLTEVGPGVLRLEGDDDGRILCQFVVVGSDSVLLVDTGLPGTPGRTILPLLKELGCERLNVLLTHPDADHCGGTSELMAARPDAQVLAHKLDQDLFGNPRRTIAERYQPYQATDAIGIPAASLERIRARLGASYTVTRVLTGEEEVDLGGRCAIILHLPGHSPGHTAAWLPDDGVLIAGDALMGLGIPKRDGGLLYAPQFFSPAVYEETARRIDDLGVRLLLCAHEPPRCAEEADAFIAESRASSERLAGLARSALEEGEATLAETCARVHAAYGGLPQNDSASLAVTVAGILLRLAATQAVRIDTTTKPRRFSLAEA